jgi:hypothetical protein
MNAQAQGNETMISLCYMGSSNLTHKGETIIISISLTFEEYSLKCHQLEIM